MKTNVCRCKATRVNYAAKFLWNRKMQNVKQTWVFVGFMLMAGVLFLPGCARSDAGERIYRQSRVGLVAQTHEVVAEVPIPIGFKIVEDKSREWKTDGFLYTEYLFQGKSTLSDTVVFYRSQLRTNGWNLAGEQMDGAIVLLRAAKPNVGLGLQVSQRGSVTSIWVQTKRPAP